MKLSTVVVFGAGYVIGTKAGRERYEEIVKVAQRISQRLDELSAREDEASGPDTAGGARAAGGHADDFGGDFDPSEEETLRGGGLEGLGRRPFARYPPVDLGRDRPRRPR